jgi:hypothetical protein
MAGTTRRYLMVVAGVLFASLWVLHNASGQCVGGVEVGGVCWFLAASGDSCDTTCSDQGLPYSQTTLTFAGSAGTSANCNAVLDALRVVGTDYDDLPCGIGQGCSFFSAGPSRFRCISPPTTSDAAPAEEQRACACGQSAVVQRARAMKLLGLVLTILSLTLIGIWRWRNRSDRADPR